LRVHHLVGRADRRLFPLDAIGENTPCRDVERGSGLNRSDAGCGRHVPEPDHGPAAAVVSRDPPQVGSAVAGALSIQNLSKSYADLRAVDRVPLEAADGEFVTLLGPSGSGKTTTLQMIAGFVQPDQGRVFLDGRELTAVPAYRRNIGMVFQN